MVNQGCRTTAVITEPSMVPLSVSVMQPFPGNYFWFVKRSMITLGGSLNLPKTCACHSERFLLLSIMNNGGFKRPAADAKNPAFICVFIP